MKYVYIERFKNFSLLKNSALTCNNSLILEFLLFFYQDKIEAKFNLKSMLDINKLNEIGKSMLNVFFINFILSNYSLEFYWKTIVKCCTKGKTS